MKKEDFFTLIVYAIMVSIALFVGVNIIAPAFIRLGIAGLNQYVYAIITILAGFLVNVILLEVGHVLGALVGGYEIKMVNFLGLALVKNEKHWQIKIQSFEGLTGETTIVPKAKNVKPKPYLWGGLILYFLEMIIGFIIAYGVFEESQWGRYAIVVMIAIGGMLMIYNFMPFKLDTVTDGYRLATLTTPKGNEAYQELQRIEKVYKAGQNPKPFKEFKDINSLTIQIYFHKIYQAMVEENYEEALKDLRYLGKSPRVSEAQHQRIFVLNTYLYFIQKTQKTAHKYYYQLTSKQRKFLANDTHMSTLSTYLFVAGLIEESYSETSYTIERSLVAMKKITEAGRKAAEAILFDRVLKKVKKSHPDWRF